VNYTDEGSGPPLLMLHGAGLNLHFWDRQAEYFMKHYRVVRPDFRGHGGTEAAEAPRSAPFLTGDVISLLDHLGIRQAVLMGHSLGGLVSLYAAADFPLRVNAIIVADSAGIFPPGIPRILQLREEALVLMGQGRVRDALALMNAGSFSPGFRDRNPQVFDWLLDVRMQNRPEDIARQWQGTGQAGLPPAADFGRVRCPALFIAGEMDQNLPVEYIVKAHQAVAGSTLVTLPAGHSLPVELPGPFNDAVAGFLRSAVNVMQPGLG
jgi:pimeloyl-ACP methyl ester carboxylesterase